MEFLASPLSAVPTADGAVQTTFRRPCPFEAAFCGVEAASILQTGRGSFKDASEACQDAAPSLISDDLLVCLVPDTETSTRPSSAPGLTLSA